MIIHLCNNYISSKVHRSIVENISSIGIVGQYVLVPIRRESDFGVNLFESNDVIFEYKRYPDVIKYFPFFKIFFNFFRFRRFFWRRRNLKGNDVVLAHTLWSDGAVAYLAHKIFGLRYSVVVRNTDINLFIPKLPHYKWFFRKILSRSEEIIFVNEVYRERVCTFFPDLRHRLMSGTVIYNGLDQFWLDNPYFGEYSGRNHVCYLGSFNANKNIRNIFRSVEQARAANPRIKLVLIGGSEEEFLKCAGIESKPGWVITPGRINNKTEIANYLRKSFVFSMPSFSETFGLVYLEALSQGCNLICSKGEGVDGVVNGEYITLVDPSDVNDISSAVLRYFGQDYPSKNEFEVREFLSTFAWDRVAQRYLDTINH